LILSGLVKENKDLFAYVIREEKTIVSCAFLLVIEKPMSPAFINGKTGTILNVFTRESYRRKGYARKIMDVLLAEAKAMERAIRFYEELFDQPVTEKDDTYSVFDINGFRFGLFAYQIMNEDHTFGSNCLPSIGFENVDVLKAKLDGKELCFPLTTIKENWVAEFVDSEGNHIEVTAPV